MQVGKLRTIGCNILSRNDDTFSVGPWHPLTIGLILWGCLCNFLRKYIFCVLVSGFGMRKDFVKLSTYPKLNSLSAVSLIYATSSPVGSPLSFLYVVLSLRCCMPSDIYVVAFILYNYYGSLVCFLNYNFFVLFEFSECNFFQFG